eukprot:CAMPEP_0202879792 /NCGR_PEP_ID=MMETSP1391-20130828/34114_1 /ASSEMBLY_ACC=CAM_ASM_000867 /TAXON_ID=1034604 /ORGANISM="Chlamydomonas leiostraca, Strain SAG 11-49" /LENGTH=41 /DNA_ID= /DNA_START= /DNA_END= /DNA_ORIENTATION=
MPPVLPASDDEACLRLRRSGAWVLADSAASCASVPQFDDSD